MIECMVVGWMVWGEGGEVIVCLGVVVYGEGGKEGVLEVWLDEEVVEDVEGIGIVGRLWKVL